MLWESDSEDGTLVTWSSATARCDNVHLAAGDFIKVTVKSVDKSKDPYPQAGLTTSVGDSWDWADLKSMNMPTAGNYYYEITADMLEKINSHNSIFFKGTAAYLSKVELIPNRSYPVLWTSDSGDGTLVTWSSVTARCDNVHLAAGDVIKVTVKSVDTTIDPYPQAGLTTSVGDSWDWAELKSMNMPTAGSYYYEITADMLEKINSHNSIFFKGTAAYLSKVELLKNVAVTIGEYEWATFVSDYALDFTGSDVKAYLVLGHTGTALTKSQITGTVPANTPLLLNAAKGNYTIPAVASSTTNVSTNLLKAGAGAAVSAESGKTKYVLSVTAGKAEFQKINTTAATVPTGKAYLEFNEAIEARSLDIDEGGTTAIDVISKKQDASGEYYDLQGRRVAQPKKGLYIVNGKKVIIK